MTLSVSASGHAVREDLLTDDAGLLLVIRHFESKLLDLFDRGLLNGTTHTCLGQEHVPVALAPLLTEADFVFSNHRGHGHYLALRRDPAGLLAEITGREGAVCGGVGGSQHLLNGRYLSTGVQGQSLPVAVGTALHLARSEPGAVAVAFVGDGTWGEGSVYEALNMACLWRLPLLVVTENNGIAQSTPTSMELAGTIAGRAAAFGAAHHLTGTADVAGLRAEAAPLLAAVRAGAGPHVLEVDVHRLGPHSKGDDTRPAEELRRAAEHDWYAPLAAARPDLDERARRFVDDIAEEVLSRPLSGWRP
ncbi:thiamine pyrophosphate-dependent dehydrogenase E1 component subunit alpha [Pseudonocardia sp. TRM90224]|uniref:thiamine pyrophosphate-dependent dehydrogenase E1 component subunit alpha n=1 Tax=Pseudonocardia sp. TRM90224 TaxID=2812678 RepID=UPI001E5C178B|nr:thiamine pyrophosphate-dependent dehydrogenase E1 component subunit alpha [Pseudonocardia sp. TRM90224]